MGRREHRRAVRLLLALALAAAGGARARAGADRAQQAPPPAFSVDQILSLPAPDNLTASPSGSAIAWTFNERGVRNIYFAEAPDFKARRLTAYTEDDGQELSHVSFSADGRTIVYVRGGDHGSSRPAEAPNPTASPTAPKVQIWSVPAAGGAPKLLAEGDAPVIAPDSRRVAFIKDRRLWIVPIDGSRQPESPFAARGAIESPVWSPDGRTLAFVLNRADHSFIALFAAGGAGTPANGDQPIRYLAPSTSRDSQPAWSPDGRQIAFVRQPGAGGAPRPPLAPVTPPWAILVSSLDAGDRDAAGNARAATAVTSGDSPVDSILRNPGGINLRWGADDTLLFLSYRDGWPRLYALRHPAQGGKPTLLTPGTFMVEQLALTPDRRFVIYNANTGGDRNDFDRRHLFKVPIDRAAPAPLTSGSGIEWSPAVLADGQTVAFLSSDAQRPPMPGVVPIGGGSPRVIAGDRLAADFPSAQLVTPEPVSFRASDGVEAHGQLFRPRGAGPGVRRPAVVYIHGGGPRQMLLGWHYRWEYANDYGANQYLVSRGFIVLSVNYRLSVGYGHAFQFADRTGVRGASEYQDVLAAGRYLQGRADVDPRHIGVWGASYGGYLTALGLGRNSEVFAAGVDLHGVHDRLPPVNPAQLAHAMVGDGITEADLRQSLKVAYESSPIAAVATWKSPVLLVHGDDDHTVDFHQTVDLSRRLAAKGVTVEELVLTDDVHDALLWRNWRAEIAAMAGFFERMLQPRPANRTASTPARP